MAKQKKRTNKKNLSSANPSNYSTLYKDDRNSVPTATPGASAKPAKPAAASSVPVGGKTSDSVDWRTDYAYVVRDIRHLTIVSVVLFAVIIGIGLFI